jgi:cohesin domain-containing protein
MRKFTRFLLVIASCLLMSPMMPGISWGASIAVVPSGDSAYTVQGVGFSGVAGIQLTINYDTAILANPRAVSGTLMTGSIFVVNPNTPGVIIVAIIKHPGVSGSGPIAILNFDRKAPSGGITSVSVTSMINDQGTNLAFAQPTVSNPGGGSSTTTETAGGSPASPTPLTPGGVAGAAPGISVSMPGDGGGGETKQELTKAPEAAPAVPAAETRPSSSAAADLPQDRDEKIAQQPVQKKYAAYPSVVEKFRTFSGAPTAEKLAALFVQSKELPYEQVPPIVLTDGNQTVKLIVRMEQLSKSAPNFALENAKMLSLNKGEQGEWIIEALPKKGVHEALLTLLNNESTTNIPLTVAPPLSAEQLGALRGLTEKDFSQYLKERGTKDVPRYDLNKDGKRDYLDDYIFTANYLVAKKKGTLTGRGDK